MYGVETHSHPVKETQLLGQTTTGQELNLDLNLFLVDDFTHTHTYLKFTNPLVSLKYNLSWGCTLIVTLLLLRHFGHLGVAKLKLMFKIQKQDRVLQHCISNYNKIRKSGEIWSDTILIHLWYKSNSYHWVLLVNFLVKTGFPFFPDQKRVSRIFPVPVFFPVSVYHLTTSSLFSYASFVFF